MAKLTIELDVPDAIMKLAMSEKSEEGLKELCQVICQEEFDKINREFLSTISPIPQLMFQKIEKMIRSGKMALGSDTPELLRHIYNAVKSGESSLEAEFEEHNDELVEWVAGKRKRETPTPFDCFEGLIKEG